MDKIICGSVQVFKHIDIKILGIQVVIVESISSDRNIESINKFKLYSFQKKLIDSSTRKISGLIRE